MHFLIQKEAIYSLFKNSSYNYRICSKYFIATIYLFIENEEGREGFLRRYQNFTS